VTVVEE
jgi:hypothetical protein